MNGGNKMLYLGADLNSNCVNITAISEGFSFLDQLSLVMGDYSVFSRWIKPLLLNDDEYISWYFCEQNFHSWNDIPFFLNGTSQKNLIFLVKDRVVKNMYNLCDTLFFRDRYFRDFNLSYLLAASYGLFDQKYVYQYKKGVDSNFC